MPCRINSVYLKRKTDIRIDSDACAHAHQRVQMREGIHLVEVRVRVQRGAGVCRRRDDWGRWDSNSEVSLDIRPL